MPSADFGALATPEADLPRDTSACFGVPPENPRAGWPRKKTNIKHKHAQDRTRERVHDPLTTITSFYTVEFVQLVVVQNRGFANILSSFCLFASQRPVKE